MKAGQTFMQRTNRGSVHGQSGSERPHSPAGQSGKPN